MISILSLPELGTFLFSRKPNNRSYMNNIDRIKKNLNERQLEAVTETEGYVRVIAGAGSGKTKALTSRYAYIAEALGINSSNILCVTFTNKAANEMKKRVKELIGENADLTFITTYHGFCVRLLREDISKIGYPRSFVIMDTDDQKTALREIYNELGITSRDYTFKEALSFIAMEKGITDYLQYVVAEKEKQANSMLEKIWLRYLEKQQRNFALDFDDLINFGLHVLQSFPDVLEKWQRRLHYIQVDETQDSSPKQFLLVHLLSQYHQNLFVVGDPDQTIYEWRGAKPEILVDFDIEFQGAKTIVMDQNYRSTPNILSLGNHIIRNNKIRVDKDMFTNNPNGVDVVHYHAPSDFDEALWIIREIKQLVKNNKATHSDIAVLYRANFISRSIEQALIKEEIPYSIYGGIRFFERKEIKDVLAYLRLIEFGDDMAFLRVFNSPARGLGKKFIEELSFLARKDNISLYSALKSNITTKGIGRKGAVRFLEIIENCKELKKTLNISDLVKVILDETGLTNMYRNDGDTERLENIKELQNSIILSESQDEKPTLADYLQDISLYTDIDIEDEKKERVKLMTIHTSKGLEFPYVFLAGFTEGILPSAMSLKERRGRALEEERRLTYVAITRAERGLYLTESEGFNFSTGMNKYPSRFLFEISENLYVRKGTLHKELIEEAKNFIFFSEERMCGDNRFKVGDIVNHIIWNRGKVLRVDEKRNEYEIEFYELNKVKPITFEFKGLSKIEEN